jgi:hypothetical protein
MASSGVPFPETTASNSSWVSLDISATPSTPADAAWIAVEWLLTHNQILPGSPEYIRTLINGWDTPHMQTYLRDMLSKDPLIGNEFEVTQLGLQVKSQSQVLDAHFGDLIVDKNTKLNLRVVPGVILKRLIASIFWLDLYSDTKLPPVSIAFKSGVIPGAVIWFELMPTGKDISENIPKLSLFTGTGENKKLALSLSNEEGISPEVLSQLQAAAIKPRSESSIFSPTAPLEYLAQWGDFRFALNTAVIDAEAKIYQTNLGYPRQIATHATLSHRSPSVVFVRNSQTLDYEVPWEIVEEAVCQAATIAAQKNLFAPKDRVNTAPVSAERVLTSDTLVVLSRSTPQIHRKTLMSERESFKITLKVESTKWPTSKIIYVVTSGLQGNLVASGVIVGTRIPKKALAENLYPQA